MNIFLACFLNGLYKEYKWLYSEYKINWSNPKKTYGTNAQGNKDYNQ
jgi:hypothetical protein